MRAGSGLRSGQWQIVLKPKYHVISSQRWQKACDGRIRAQLQPNSKGRKGLLVQRPLHQTDGLIQRESELSEAKSIVEDNSSEDARNPNIVEGNRPRGILLLNILVS